MIGRLDPFGRSEKKKPKVRVSFGQDSNQGRNARLALGNGDEVKKKDTGGQQ